MPLCTEDYRSELRMYPEGTQVFCADEPITIPQLASRFGISIEILVTTNPILIDTPSDEDISGFAYFIPPSTADEEDTQGAFPFPVVPSYSEIQAQQEAEQQQRNAASLVEEQEADRRMPLTEEAVNRLLVELATAEHYADMFEAVNNDPTAMLAEALLLPGQELSEDAKQVGYKHWLVQYLYDNKNLIDRNAYEVYSVEALEAQVKPSLIAHIDMIANQICTSLSSQAESICTQHYDTDYSSMSIEQLLHELEYMAEQFQQVATELGSPVVGLNAPSELEASRDLRASYYDTLDQAQIEAIIANWNQEGDRALLDQLLVAIGEMPISIWGFSVEWVKQSVLDYYGKMEARHQILAEIVAPRQEAQRISDEQEASARDYYLKIIWEDSDYIDPELVNASTQELNYEAYGISAENNTWLEFKLTQNAIYGVDSYASLKEATSAAMLILSFVPVVGTAVDIIEGIHAWQQGDRLGVALSFIGPLGDAARLMPRLGRIGDNAANIIRNTDAAGDIIDEARPSVDMVHEMFRRADELEEATVAIRAARVSESQRRFNFLSARYMPFDKVTNIRPIPDFMYPREWRNLSDEARQRMFQNPAQIYQEWQRTTEAAHVADAEMLWLADPNKSLSITMPISYYGLGDLSRRFKREIAETITQAGRNNLWLGNPPTLLDKIQGYLGFGDGSGGSVRSSLYGSFIYGGDIHTHPPMGIFDMLPDNNSMHLQGPSLADWERFESTLKMGYIPSTSQFHFTIVPRRQRYVIHYGIDANGNLFWTRQDLPYQLV